MRAAIFDLDGTIIDSTWVWDNAGQQLLATQGVTPGEGDEIVKTMSFQASALYFLEKYHLSLTLEDIMNFWFSFARDQYENHVEAKPFAKEYLCRLYEQGVKLCLATAANRKLATSVLDRLGIYELFHVFVTVDEFGKGKATPDIFLHSAKLLETEPQDCVVFEDSLYAVESALSAGFQVYGVFDERSVADVDRMAAICDKLITSYVELL